jgi:hypothetical protein
VKHKKRVIGALAIMLLGIFNLGAGPAEASGAFMTVDGTIGPNGIPGPTGGTVANGNINFTGTETGVFMNMSGPTADAGSCSVSFTGGGTDSLAVGSGNGTETCNGTGVLGNTISRHCVVSYTRVGAYWVEIGNCTGFGSGRLVRNCTFINNNVNPTTSGRKVCVTVY